ncbi:hypothetical protein JL49_13205 [Pseudoalteromonas luteoviolacea]|nr:hypothetical protein JL49_13205 [Pseudoalteromonas luteoviolacea]
MMSTINKELYQALLEANVSEEKAAAAAETDMKIHTELAEVKARLALVEKLQWVVVAGVIGLLLKAYILGA